MKPNNLSNIYRSGVAFKNRPSSVSSASADDNDDAALKIVTGSGGVSRYHRESNKSLEDINVVDPLQQRKEAARERKQMYVFDNHRGRFNKLGNMLANRLGTPTTIQVFDRLGRVNSVTQGNALIKICIEGARIATDEATAEKEMQHAFHVFKDMKEQGFPIEEKTYGPILEYLIDMRMTEKFSLFCKVIKKDNVPFLTSKIEIL